MSNFEKAIKQAKYDVRDDIKRELIKEKGVTKLVKIKMPNSSPKVKKVKWGALDEILRASRVGVIGESNGMEVENSVQSIQSSGDSETSG